MPECAEKITSAVLKSDMILDKNEKQSCNKEKRNPEQSITNERNESFLHDFIPKSYVETAFFVLP